MVIQSTRNYQLHKKQIYEVVKKKYGEQRAKKFIDFFSQRYDKYNRSFIDHKLAIALMDDYKYCERIGTKWYAFVGVGGTGKSTIAKNVFYFLDPTFSHQRITTDIKKLVKIISELPSTNALNACFMDEPDDSIIANSKDGKILRKIFGKIRQQQIFIGICATDLKDIPPYIFRKLDGVFFTPYLSKGMYFKNRPKQKSYILQKIRFHYDRKGYSIFFELQKEKGCILFDTHKYTPIDFEEKQYLKDKREDFESDIKDFLTKEKPKEKRINIRNKIIYNMKDKGLTDKHISDYIGLSRSRITQILSDRG